jgi:hypothetical protein
VRPFRKAAWRGGVFVPDELLARRGGVTSLPGLKSRVSNAENE